MPNSISGRIYDVGKNGMPNATVTLWMKNEAGKLIKPVAIAENPQYSNDGRTAETGTYRFLAVPPGRYAVTAEKNMVLGRREIEIDDYDIANLNIILDSKSVALPKK